MPREIITLQFGPLSNMVGSHFWNIQATQLAADLKAQDASNDAEPWAHPDTLFRRVRSVREPHLARRERSHRSVLPPRVCCYKRDCVRRHGDGANGENDESHEAAARAAEGSTTARVALHGAREAVHAD